MPSSRTETYASPTLNLPGPSGPAFHFTDLNSTVTIVLPATSRWQMSYHWHLTPSRCELVKILPGGDAEFFRSLGPYRNSSESGHAGMTSQLRPGERCYWRTNTHRPPRPEHPPVEVVVSNQDAGQLWRNIVSATQDAHLWPDRASTPPLIRLVLWLLRRVPVVGVLLWELVVAWALRVQLRMIQGRHEFWVWGGLVPITWLWDGWPWPGNAPKWAQHAEWRSAEVMAKVKCNVAFVLGTFVLGMKDGYREYYRTDCCRENVPEKS